MTAAAATEKTPAMVLDVVEQLAAAVRTNLESRAEIERLLADLKGPGPGRGNYGIDDHEQPLLPNAYRSYTLGFALEAAATDLEDQVGFGPSSPAWEGVPESIDILVGLARFAVAQEAVR